MWTVLIAANSHMYVRAVSCQAARKGTLSRKFRNPAGHIVEVLCLWCQEHTFIRPRFCSLEVARPSFFLVLSGILPPFNILLVFWLCPAIHLLFSPHLPLFFIRSG